MSKFECPPDHPDCVWVDTLADAIAAGDVPGLVAALRALATLEPPASNSALALLADVFDDNQTLRSLYPQRLKFVPRKGKPADKMQKGAARFSIARAIDEEVLELKKIDLAVRAVSKRLKLSKSTVYAEWRKARENTEIDSK